MALSLVLVMFFSLFPQLMVFSSLPETALAASVSLATLEEVSGGVYVKKGGGAKEFKGIKGMALTQGDSVRTEKGGSAVLVFTTGSKMSVGPSTLFTLSKAAPTKDSGEKVSVKLQSGSLWNKVKKLMNVEDEYQIETPTTVMGVRGTLFLVSVDPVNGNTMNAVMEGSVGAQQNTMRNMGPQEQLVFMGSVIQVPPSILQYSAPQPPPTPAPINMNTLVESQSPVILGNIALDVVERMQELQEQSQAYFAGYQNTGNPVYIQGALQFSQINTLLGELSSQYLDAVQGSAQEQQVNQVLQQHNSSVDSLSQKSQQITEQVQERRNTLIEAAQQAGLNADQIGRLLQNAGTAGGAAGAGTSPILPSAAPPAPPAPPGTPTQPSGGGGSSRDNDRDSGTSLPVKIGDFRSTEVSSGEVRFAWTAAVNATQIKLQSSLNQLTWTDCTVEGGSVGATATTAKVTDLTPNTQYYFKLVVTGGANRGDSNTVQVRTASAPGPNTIALTGIGSITGTAKVGSALTAGAIAPGGATVTYQWLRAASLNGEYTSIEGATASQYTPTANDLNKYIKVRATGYSSYTGIMISAAVQVIWTSQEEAGPKAASLGVVLRKTHSSGDNNADYFKYQAGDRVEFYFDRPVKAEPLSTRQVWEDALKAADPAASFGAMYSGVQYEDQDQDGYAESFSLEVKHEHDKTFKLPEAGMELRLPASLVVDKEGKRAAADVKFTLPALRKNSNYTEQGASVVNLDRLDSLRSIPEDEGAYGVFGEAGLPGRVLLRGVLSDTIPDKESGEWNLTHLPRLEAGLWYYGENYEKQYISPYGEVRSEWMGIEAEVVALRSATGDGDHGAIYTWEVELTPGLRGALWNSSNRDYFLALKIMDGNQGEARLLEAVGAMTGDMERPYVKSMKLDTDEGILRVTFNEYLEEGEILPGVLFLNLIPLGQIIQALTIERAQIVSEGWESSLIIQLDHDSASKLQNLPGYASLSLTANYGMSQDRAGNILQGFGDLLFRHAPAGVSGEWTKDPYPGLVSQGGVGNGLVIQAGEMMHSRDAGVPGALIAIENGRDLREYFRLTSTTGSAITAGLAGAVYSSVGGRGAITLTFEQGFVPEEFTYLELLPGLFCEHGYPFETGVSTKVNGEERAVLGVFREGGYSALSDEFRLLLDPDSSRKTNEGLAFLVRSWPLSNIGSGGDLKNRFVMKNVIDTDRGRYYRPTTARFTEAVYQEGATGSHAYEVVFKLEPGNLRAYEKDTVTGVQKYGVIKMLPALQEHWRFKTPGTGEDELTPWYLPLMLWYMPHGTWGGV